MVDSIINGSNAIILFFLCILFLFINSRNKKANKILALLFFLLFFYKIETIFYDLELYINAPILIDLDFFFLFSEIPLLYLYTKVLLNPNYKFSKKDLLHYLLFGVNLIFASIIFFQTPEIKLEILNFYAYEILPKNNLESLIIFYEFYTSTIDSLEVIQFFIYFILIFRYLNKYLKELKTRLSTINKAILKWIKVLVILFIPEFLFDFISILIPEDIASYAFLTNVLNNIRIVYEISIIFFLGIFSLKQPEITLYIEQNYLSKIIPKNKYEKSTLTHQETKNYYSTLNKIINENKPYLNNEFRFKELAELIGISTHILSQVLNKMTNNNFYNYINRLRIEHSKKLLKTSKDLSIIEIAFNSGFNSKSTFNKAFKKYLKITPTQYRKRA